MRVNFFTNVSACQINEKSPGRWVVSSIPVTVDDDVMNGIYYPASENKLGINTYIGRPVTLEHPRDENGNPTSAMSKNGLMDHFSGGAIVSAYNHQGINYMDVEFKEALLAAQDNGEYYINRLKSKLPIGVSTGLTFIGNDESGVAPNGKEYMAIAKGQVGDHLAMLPEDQAPAGGNNTFIRFNGENDDQEITINIDEFIANMEADPKTKTLFDKFFDKCKQTFALLETNSDNNQDLNNNDEGCAMRETMIAALAAKGIAVNADISDADLLAKYNESNQPDVSAAINAAVQPLMDKLGQLETAVNAKETAELDAKAEKVAEILGVESEAAKAMGVNALDKVLAKNGHVIGSPMATNHQSPKDKDTSIFAKVPWETK